MTPDTIEVHLVLDTSAILAYITGSINVGETISEADADGGYFALPTVCLAEANRLRSADQDHALLLLTRHTRAVVFSAKNADWRVLGEWTRRLGRVDLASAMTDALACKAYVLTGESDAYGGTKQTPNIIPI